MRHNLVLAALAATLALPARAQTAQVPQNTGDEIVVTAGRFEQRRDEVGQSITVLDQQTIETRQTAVVSDLLRTTPGVTVIRNGPVGATTSVSIRGAEPSQTLVLIDGIRVGDPSSPSGDFDFGSLLTGNISRIELLRGPNSVIWGSQAIGGVIDIQTTEPGDHLAVNARAEGGYRGTAQFVANASDTLGPVHASVGGGYFRTEGISAFDEALGGRERDGYEQFALNGKVRIDLTDNLNLDLRAYYDHGKVGIDGYPPPNYIFGDTREVSYKTELLGHAGANLKLFDGRFRNRFAFTYTNVGRHNDDPTSVPASTFASNGRLERYEYQGVFDVARPLTLVAGAEHEDSSLRALSIFDPTPIPTRASVGITSGYGEAILKPVDGVTLTGGVRQDQHDTFGGHTSFGANAALTPNHGRTLLRATYAEGFKAPTLFQLQSIYGNANLKPETARSYDVGVEQRLIGDTLAAGLTYFHRDTTNQINFIFCTGVTTGVCTNRSQGTYDNIARTRAAGVEATLLLHPAPNFDVKAQYSYINAKNRSPGADFGLRLPRRPQDTASVSADYRFPFRLSLGATATIVGDSYDDVSNGTRLNGYALIDLRAAYEIRKGLEVYGRVENLGDQRYETIFRYGTYHRAAYGGVRASF